MDISPSKEFFFGETTPWEEVGPGLKRQMMGYDGKIMLVKVAFEVGAVGNIHEHYHSQVSYVESGEFEMTIGDQVKTIKSRGFLLYPTPCKTWMCVYKERRLNRCL